MDTVNEDILPNALMIGVDYDLFWRLNPKTLSPFVKAFSLRQRNDDVTAWRNGLYVKYAITSSFNKEVKYPPQPLLYENDDENNEEKMREKIRQRIEILNMRFGKEE